MRRLFLSIVAAWFAGGWVAGQPARIDVYADQTIGSVSPYMAGACIEDVNHEVYGGIYSQLIFGESFAEPPKAQSPGVSGMWRPIRRGDAMGSFDIDATHPFVGQSSQQISFTAGSGEVGIENQGLNRSGIGLVGGKDYQGHLWVRAKPNATVFVAIESADGQRVYGESRIEVQAGDWRKESFTLTPTTTDPAARFAIKLKQPGSVDVGYVYLEPGEWGRFKGLPLRKDVAEGLIAQGLTVLRYGGSMVNAPEYRWKKMIGLRDRRPPYKGTWYPYSSNGWGIIDFVSFCEAAGFLPVPAFNMDESPRDMADFMEYVNGPADSPWGRRRAQDGHPAPFHLTHIELGNEESIDEHYWERFKPLAEAIWAKDPDVIPVVGDFAYGRKIADPFHFDGAPRIHTLAAHQKILELARQHNREVWFDVHVGTERPREPAGLGGIPSFIDALGRLGPGARYKVVVFELNANRHDLARALSNAYAINELDRLGDRVPIVCSANCLQVDRRNDNGWNQGLLFLNSAKVWPQPPYFVTQMISRSNLPLCVRADVQSPANALDATALISPDHARLHLQVVNLEGRPVEAGIALHGFTFSGANVRVTELAGELRDVNTAQDPERVRSRETRWLAPFRGGAASFTFAPNSFTVLELDPKQ